MTERDAIERRWVWRHVQMWALPCPERIRTMKWEQIESKWALMTRRIRADLGDPERGAGEGYGHAYTRRDAISSSIAESQVAARKDHKPKTSAK
jgi:hypothetical protein